MTAPDRPRYTREDLDELKERSRAGVFEALGSFDDVELAGPQFVDAALCLLDPQRVPGLAAALGENDHAAALAAVAAACTPQAPGDHDAPYSARASTDDPTPKPSAKISDQELRRAEEVLEHRFTFYEEQYQLPADIDWDHNPGTNHWGQDLNRFSFLRPLTRACLATGQERYGRKAVELILDWVAKCDAARCFRGSPHVWGSYLNNAIHCETWAWCLGRLLPRGIVEPLELLRILKSLHDQLAYLEIVTGRHRGNWPTIGCRGILATLAELPVFRDTDRWVAYAREALAVQLADQILPDGAQFELTPHYHNVVVRNVLTAVGSLERLGSALPEAAEELLRKMIHYSQCLTNPAGTRQIAFNDSDPDVPPRHAGALEALGRSGYMLGAAELGPRVFPHAGVALLRQRASEGDLYLAFDAGPFGAGHQHEDKLGLWLHAHGQDLLVDPGRHLYELKPVSYFPHLRSTRAHSTLRIDDRDQHSRARPETWIAREPLDLGWVEAPGELRALGAYELGYGEENEIPAVHRREVVFLAESCWLVFDAVEEPGGPERTVESRWQFGPLPASLEAADGAAVARTGTPDGNLLLVSRAEPAGGWDEARLAEGEEDPREGWFSGVYGRIRPAPCLILRQRAGLPFRAATLLLPYRGAEAPPAELRFADAADGALTVALTLPGGEVRQVSSRL